ncbi:MAG: leucine-rich repeat domain-containing protein [Lachnospiraceae bacterium]|nr:leucine-rich repeat domain-containing protein [Lachnospiraceae bacterium]
MSLVIKDGVLKKYDGGEENVIIPDEVKKIGFKAFYESKGLKRIEMPDTVEEIGKNAFSECWDLEDVRISNGIEVLDDYVLYGCSSLTSITLPCKLKKIGKSTFACCSKLNCIEIPNGVTFIGQSAFSDCYSLTDICIPDSVTEIGKDCFYQCFNLKRLLLPSSISEFDPKILGAKSKIEIIIATGITPDKVKPAWRVKFVAGYLKSLSLPDGCRMDASWEKPTMDMLKKNPEKIYPAAAADQDVLNVMIERNIITESEAEQILHPVGR